MQKHCIPAQYSKKSPPVWLSDQSCHPQTHPSPGSTTFLATSSEFGFGFFFQNLSFPCGSIHSTRLWNTRMDATASGMAGSCRSARSLQHWGKRRRKQEKDRSQSSLCLLPPRCSACPGSSRAPGLGWEAGLAELGALGRCCTRLDPEGVRIGEAASSRGLGRLCLNVSGTGSGMLCPDRSGTGSRTEVWD